MMDSKPNLKHPTARLTVVLTRPVGQAHDLAQALAAHALDTFEFPLIKLQAVAPDVALQTAFAALERYALVVFVSPNAIEYAFKHIHQPWPRAVPIGVLGPGSARALASQQITAPTHRVIAPVDTVDTTLQQIPRYDSEALAYTLDQTLGLSSFKDQRVLIVRGNDGRPWLANCLRSHGAMVDIVTAYQRLLPTSTPSQWMRVRELLAGVPHAWLMTSSESVRNLQTLAHMYLDTSQQALLKQARLVVTHARIAESAHALGFGTITQTAAGDASIIRTLLSLRSEPV